MDTPGGWFEHPRLKPIKEFLFKYRRHIPAAALLFGFVWDLLTLGRPDRLFENLVIISYLIIAGGTILLLNLKQRRGEEGNTLPLVALLQFSFGNLASALLVLYGHSGTFEGSLLFFLILGGFLIGNEFLRDRYSLIRAHIGAYFLLLFAYFALVVPIALNDISTQAFLISGATALLTIAAFVGVLFAVNRRVMAKNLLALGLVVGGVYGVFNFLYFVNILPPVPLALREIGIYHGLTRETDGSYIAAYEAPRWYEFFNTTSNTFTASPGAHAYCFSSVFAPTGLSTSINHRWERQEASGEWKTLSLVSFSIVGGRETGYRGYSIKTALSAGEWRCSVETPRGALIGRESFTIISATSTPPLTWSVF